MYVLRLWTRGPPRTRSRWVECTVTKGLREDVLSLWGLRWSTPRVIVHSHACALSVSISALLALYKYSFKYLRIRPCSMQMISVIYFGSFLYVEHFVIVKFIFTATDYTSTLCGCKCFFIRIWPHCQQTTSIQMNTRWVLKYIPLGPSFAWAADEEDAEFLVQEIYQQGLVVTRCAFTNVFLCARQFAFAWLAKKLFLFL